MSAQFPAGLGMFPTGLDMGPLSYRANRPEEEVEEWIAFDDLPTSQSFRPAVVIFIGWRGGGKTLTQTLQCLAQRAMMRERGYEWQLWSNYNITGSERLGIPPADVVSPLLVDQVIEFPQDMRQLTIAIDEIQSAFPGRRSLSNFNTLFSQFLTQIRKREVECSATTQFPQVLDYQVLLQTDLFCRCETVAGGRGVRLFYYDWWGQFTGRMDRRRWPPDKFDFDWEWMMPGTDMGFELYNSSEVVVPVFSKKRMAILEAEGWAFEYENDRDRIHTAPEDLGLDPAEQERRGAMLFDSTLETKKESGAGGRYELAGLLDEARRVMPSQIRSKDDLVTYLERRGFRITKDNGQWVAEVID